MPVEPAFPRSAANGLVIGLGLGLELGFAAVCGDCARGPVAWFCAGFGTGAGGTGAGGTGAAIEPVVNDV